MNESTKTKNAKPKKHTSTILKEAIENGEFAGKDLLKAISLLAKLRSRRKKTPKPSKPPKPNKILADFRKEHGI